MGCYFHGDEDAAKQAPNKPAFVQATSMRSEPTMFPGRDQVNPQAGRDAAAHLWDKAGTARRSPRVRKLAMRREQT